ncbi:MAG TPA: hypothetical protein PLG86_05670 [Bacteroidales bacterium]|nr:hypothetical protein [Bacteroidales bacterium]HPT04607.1 hypothetical protein [Bacteroidales bacterium]
MKKLVKAVLAATLGLSLVILAGCGGGGSNVSTKGVFGKLPAIVDKYSTKIDKIDADLKEVKSLDKAFKLSQEQKQLKDEMEKTFEETFKGMGTVAVPFEQTGSKDQYTIKSCNVTKVHSGNHVVLELEVESINGLEPMKFSPSAKGILLDDKGLVLDSSVYMGSYMDRTKGLKKGEILKFSGGVKLNASLGNAAKIKIAIKQD